MKFSLPVLGALAALSFFASSETRADNMASIAIAPATGAVSLTQRWPIGGNLAGFRLMAQDLSLGGGANQFYSLKSTPIPLGGDTSAFSIYLAGSGAKTDHADIGSKLTPNSYSALASADPDLGFGSVQLYFIHHKTDGDYFSHLVPGSGTSSAVTDLKPMSGPGGPATGGASGYFGLAFAAADLGYGVNSFYYLRTDSVTHTTKFGTLVPALAGASTDKFDLGISGHNALEFTNTDVGYGLNKLYFERLDPITGFTILGTLDPITGRAADIANLGSVFSTLAFVPGDVGFGSGQFYTTGAVNATWQSVSFAALADRLISAGSFTVTPSASSTLPIVLTVVPGSVGAASITGPTAGVYTVTPTAPGLITLQATQAGQLGSFEFNMLRQSFTATGLATLAITSQPTSHSAVTGTTTTFTVTASGTTTLSYQWRKAGVNISGNASATTATLSLANVQAADIANYDVAVTNTSGTILSNAVTLTVTTAAPVITNTPLSAAATVGSPFSFTIAATNTPTSYSASPLPPGVNFTAATGVLSGTPTTVGTTSVLLGATNGTGSGSATLTITTAAAGAAPIITNSPLTAAGTIGTPFSFTIVASGSPTSYTATPLPAGLSIVAATGAITGTPSAVGTTSVLLGATNGTGTGTATLTITVAAAGVAPIITNNPLAAAGTVGTPFSFSITASGSPTSYTATPLPAGLSIVAATGAITGTPTAVGTTSVLLGATNATGTGNATLVITVAAAGAAPVITNSPLTAPGTIGTPFSFTIVATGTPTNYTATPLPAGLTIVAATGVITGTPTAVGTTSVLLGATNATGTGNATLVITVAAAGVAPVITNSPLAAAGTVGTPFSFTITASGSPTSYSASPLPAGLTIVAATGVITGTPTTVGTTAVLLGATNATGTGTATLTITVAAAGVAPIIANSPLTAAGTVGTPFSFAIAASGTPTSYSASPLPAGLSIVALTGAITGTPANAGTTAVLLSATNGTGTGTATLTITVAAAGVAPFITNSPLSAAGTVGAPFNFAITASGNPSSYGASPLPAGLTVSPLTGIITGTPTSVGTTLVQLSASSGFGTGTSTLVITVASAGDIPSVTNNPLTAAGTVGTPFSFITTTTGANSFGASGLPPGLTINGFTGALSGIPTQAGVSLVALTATNATGTGTATLTITITAAGIAPVITSPATAPGTVGVAFVTYLIAGSGLPTSYTATGLPAGLTVNPLTGAINGTPTVAGTFTVTVTATNATGTTSATLVITVAAAGIPPAITSPTTAPGVVGTPFATYLIGATGQPTSYTATGLPAGLTLNPLTGAISGTPTVSGTFAVTITATNATGTTSAKLTITISAALVSRIVNFSARALSGPGDQSLIMGFVVQGDNKNLLVRGIGPGLAPYGVVNFLADPFLTLFGTGGALVTNDDWQSTDGALIAATGARVGAFALPAGSKDAALLFAFNNGAHTTSMLRPNSTTGVALTEIYDTDPTGASRLINVSARMNVTTGEGTLIAGIVIAGNAPTTVLIRGVGPTLTAFGVTGVLADPTISVFSGTTQIATNDNWETGGAGSAPIIAASARAGAFALPAGSKDAVLLLTLQPGAYTVQVTGVANTTGVALVEVYDVN